MDDFYYCLKCNHNHHLNMRKDGRAIEWSIYWKHKKYKKME